MGLIADILMDVMPVLGEVDEDLQPATTYQIVVDSYSPATGENTTTINYEDCPATYLEYSDYERSINVNINMTDQKVLIPYKWFVEEEITVKPSPTGHRLLKSDGSVWDIEYTKLSPADALVTCRIRPRTMT
jgi:hypothetical protein